MASDFFVDTSGFYAWLVRGDASHPAASRILSEARTARRGFVTTDYVLEEAATLLMARGLGQLAEPLFATVFDSPAYRLEWIDPDRFAAARRLFQRHHESRWSFTDCVSIHVMRELRLSEALTTDEHFEQAGLKALLRLP